MKLGYGGTKEEMQRLLDEAEKISGIEYDISSYADIVDAIHVVQTEMGITGTTAKEASTTISGSVSSMKSAWQNLVTGIADENANLDELIGNLVDSVVTVGENVIPRVEQALSGIGTAVTNLAPIISEAIPELVTNVLPALLESAASVVSTLATAIVEQLPAFLETAMEIIVTISNGISESLPELIPTIVDVVIQIVETLIDNVDMLVDAALEIILALTDGLIESLPKLIEEIPGLVIKIVEAIIENAPKLLESAAEIIAKLTSGLIEGFVGISIKIGEWLYDNIVQPIIDKVSDFKDAGKQLLEGIWNGISDKVTWLKEKVSGVVDKIKGWFTGKDGFDEHSPSKWSKQVFRYVMEGGGEGLDAGLPGLMQSVGSVTDRVKSGLDFGTASVDFASSGIGSIGEKVYGGSISNSDPITIIVQSVLDGKIIGETAYKYNRQMQRAMGV